MVFLAASFSRRQITALQTPPARPEMNMLRKLFQMLFGKRVRPELAYVPVRPIPPARMRSHPRGGFATSP
jgi:hypothetical protein